MKMNSDSHRYENTIHKMTDCTYLISPGAVTLRLCRICVDKIIEDLKLSNRILLDTTQVQFLITRFSLCIRCIHHSEQGIIQLATYGSHDFKQIRGGYADYTSDIGDTIEIKVHNIPRKKFLSAKNSGNDLPLTEDEKK